MLQIDFYTKEHCPLCDDAIELLELFKEEYPFMLNEHDIYTNDQWLEKYQLIIPVIDIGGKQLNAGQITYESINTLLQEATSAKK